MTSIELIGLNTDPKIGEYCKKRKIKLIPFPIKKYEIPVEEDTFKAIGALELYSLVSRTGLPKREFNGIPVIVYGSSSFHHITHGILKKVIDPNLERLDLEEDSHLGFIADGRVKREYSIIHIDNHSDDRNRVKIRGSGKRMHDCGTHLGDSIVCIDSACKATGALHISTIKNSAAVFRYHKHYDEPTDIITKLHLRDIRGNEEKKHLLKDGAYDILKFSDMPALDDIIVESSSRNVYITVDIDVLSKRHIDIETYEDYDQGNMSLKDLNHIVKMLFHSKKVIGFDICGMTPDPRSERVYDSLIQTIVER